MTLSLLLTRIWLGFKSRMTDDERGVTTVEYALLLVGMAAAVGAALLVLGPRIEGMFDNAPEIPGGE